MSVLIHAKDEMERAGFDPQEKEVMLEILARFFETWNSGGAVCVAQDVLTRLISCQPLTPLTGEDDEWMEVGYEDCNEPGSGALYQNVRSPSIFKNSNRAYDIDLPQTDGKWTTITFPYDPTTKKLREPVFDVRTED